MTTLEFAIIVIAVAPIFDFANGWLDSPILGLILGSATMLAITWLCRRRTPARVSRLFRKLQLVSAALYSLGHGGNDAQKTMGIVAGVLVAANLDAQATVRIPIWVVVACHAAMGLGTLFGGLRIVRTMGHRITRLTPVSGFAAETAGAATLFLATQGGIPVSTTHAIAGAIAGVGSLHRFSGGVLANRAEHGMGLGADHASIGVDQRGGLPVRGGSEVVRIVVINLLLT